MWTWSNHHQNKGHTTTTAKIIFVVSSLWCEIFLSIKVKRFWKFFEFFFSSKMNISNFFFNWNSNMIEWQCIEMSGISFFLKYFLILTIIFEKYHFNSFSRNDLSRNNLLFISGFICRLKKIISLFHWWIFF